jgi:hypothetical protein
MVKVAFNTSKFFTNHCENPVPEKEQATHPSLASPPYAVLSRSRRPSDPAARRLHGAALSGRQVKGSPPPPHPPTPPPSCMIWVCLLCGSKLLPVFLRPYFGVWVFVLLSSSWYGAITGKFLCKSLSWLPHLTDLTFYPYRRSFHKSTNRLIYVCNTLLQCIPLFMLLC